MEVLPTNKSLTKKSFKKLQGIKASSKAYKGFIKR
jgi:hypothetical protein